MGVLAGARVCVVGVFRSVDEGQMEGGKNKEKVEESPGE